MDKEQFLKSGLLEQYVLGLTDSEEDELVNHYLERFPELDTEINNLHQALMTYAVHQDIPSPKRDPLPTVNKANHKTLLGSLAWIPLVVLAALLFWTYQNSQQHQVQVLQLEAEYAALKNYCEQTKDKHNSTQAIIAGSDAILLQASQEEQSHFAVAYWNPEHSSCWLDPAQLPSLDKGLQYQVWADVHGEMISIGLIPIDAKEFIHLDFIAEAESINITIEKLGGAEHPNVDLLTVNGLL